MRIFVLLFNIQFDYDENRLEYLMKGLKCFSFKILSINFHIFIIEFEYHIILIN